MLVGYLQKLGNRRQMQALLRQFRRTMDSETAVRLIYRKSIEELLQAATK